MDRKGQRSKGKEREEEEVKPKDRTINAVNKKIN